MSGVFNFRGDAHAYTREKKIPWVLGDGFGNTIDQEKTKIRHRRFLKVASALALAWLYFYFA